MPELPRPLALAEIPPAILEVLSRLQQSGFEAFLVGGCVRDLLLSRQPQDFDVATNALPKQVQRLFRKVVPTGIQHGTVTVLHGNESVEVTTFRTEGEYLDGRRPSSVEFADEVSQDLSRRDFTINAMAFDPVHGTWVDPFGGEKDLKLGQVRCVGTPKERFLEDGLRPLRAVRFATVLGFQLDSTTQSAIPEALHVFQKVARERIREEFTKLLLANDPQRGLLLLRDTGLLHLFLPEALDPAIAFEQRSAWVENASRVLSVRLAALLFGLDGPELPLRRLTYPNQLLGEVALLSKHPVPDQAMLLTDAALRRFLARLGRSHVSDALDLAQAVRGPERVEAVRARLNAILESRPPLSPKELQLSGNEIMAELGLSPGPMVGEATRFLMEQVLEHPEWNTSSQLRRCLKNWYLRNKDK